MPFTRGQKRKAYNALAALYARSKRPRYGSSGYKTGSAKWNKPLYKVGTKFQYRRRGASSKTQAKNKHDTVETNAHSTRVPRYTTITLRKRRGKVIRTSPLIYNQTHHARYVGVGFGKQQVDTMFSIMTNDQFRTSTGATYNGQQNDKALFEMLPNAKLTGSGIWTATLPTNQDKLFVKQVDVKMEISNFAGFSGTIDVYVLKNKKNDDELPPTRWDDAMANQNPGLTVQTFAGAGSAGGAVFGAQSKNRLWATPHTVGNFKDYFDILDVKKFVLGGSESQSWHCKINVNKIMKEQYLADIMTGTKYFRDWTIHFMFIARGQVMNDETLGADEVTTAALHWGYCANVQYTMYGLDAARTQRMGPCGIQTVPTGANSADVKFVDVADAVKAASAVLT